MPDRFWEHSEIITWPNPGRNYFTFWRVLSDGTRLYEFSDMPTQTGLGNGPETGLGIDYEAAKSNMEERFGK